MKKFLCTLMMLTCGWAANAELITSLTDGTSLVIPASNLFTNGPVDGDGFTWSSTNTGSVYGFTGGYGLGNNGGWDSSLGFPYMGLNTSSGAMTISFDTAVSSVLGFFNYAPNFGGTTIAIFDTSNNLLESFTLSFATSGSNQGQYLGFARLSNQIGSLVMTNGYIVGADFSVSSMSSVPRVPEPGTLGIFGLALLVMRRLRRS